MNRLKKPKEPKSLPMNFCAEKDSCWCPHGYNDNVRNDQNRFVLQSLIIWQGINYIVESHAWCHGSTFGVNGSYFHWGADL